MLKQVLKQVGESVIVVFSEFIVCMMSQNKVKSGNTLSLTNQIRLLLALSNQSPVVKNLASKT